MATIRTAARRTFLNGYVNHPIAIMVAAEKLTGFSNE